MLRLAGALPLTCNYDGIVFGRMKFFKELMSGRKVRAKSSTAGLSRGGAAPMAGRSSPANSVRRCSMVGSIEPINTSGYSFRFFTRGETESVNYL